MSERDDAHVAWGNLPHFSAHPEHGQDTCLRALIEGCATGNKPACFQGLILLGFI